MFLFVLARCGCLVRFWGNSHTGCQKIWAETFHGPSISASYSNGHLWVGTWSKVSEIQRRYLRWLKILLTIFTVLSRHFNFLCLFCWNEIGGFKCHVWSTFVMLVTCAGFFLGTRIKSTLFLGSLFFPVFEYCLYF